MARALFLSPKNYTGFAPYFFHRISCRFLPCNFQPKELSSSSTWFLPSTIFQIISHNTNTSAHCFESLLSRNRLLFRPRLHLHATQATPLKATSVWVTLCQFSQTKRKRPFSLQKISENSLWIFFCLYQNRTFRINKTIVIVFTSKLQKCLNWFHFAV